MERLGYYRSIKVDKIKGVIRRMSRRRASGPVEKLMEFWKIQAGQATGLFNVILGSQRCLNNGSGVR